MMKLLLLVFLLMWYYPHKIKAQFLNQDFEKINLVNEKKAKRLQTECQSKNVFEKAINSCRNRKVKYYVVNRYLISDSVKNYDSTQIILDYFIFDTETSLGDFLGILTNKNGEKLITACNRIFIENDEYWTYAGVKKLKLNDSDLSHFGYGWGWEELRRYNFIFLFSVEYIDNCIWFVDENREIFILDLKNLMVYDAEDYIKKKLKGDDSKFS